MFMQEALFLIYLRPGVVSERLRREKDLSECTSWPILTK
jgi:hypothetical protein